MVRSGTILLSGKFQENRIVASRISRHMPRELDQRDCMQDTFARATHSAGRPRRDDRVSCIQPEGWLARGRHSQPNVNAPILQSQYIITYSFNYCEL